MKGLLPVSQFQRKKEGMPQKTDYQNENINKKYCGQPRTARKPNAAPL